MPQMTLNIRVEDIAKLIAGMERKEIETLSVLLTDEGKELLKRKQDIEIRKVKTLNREETFDV